jgi:hypothetical protein
MSAVDAVAVKPAIALEGVTRAYTVARSEGDLDVCERQGMRVWTAVLGAGCGLRTGLPL